MTADAYGAGEADLVVGRALAGLPRESYSLVGAVGHDFYGTQRDGVEGLPALHRRPSCAASDEYASYLRQAAERSLERCGVDHFDVLLLHNPDRVGYTSPAVWEAMAGLREAGLCDAIGVAPGPANGFTLDVIGCLERFGHLIDWAMLILNPLEPWPGGSRFRPASATACACWRAWSTTAGCSTTTCPDEDALGDTDHRRYRAAGWVEAGRAPARRVATDRRSPRPHAAAAVGRMDARPARRRVRRPDADPGGRGAGRSRSRPSARSSRPCPGTRLRRGRAGRDRRDRRQHRLHGAEGRVAAARGCERPDAWALDDELREIGRRFGIEADRDLVLR